MNLFIGSQNIPPPQQSGKSLADIFSDKNSNILSDFPDTTTTTCSENIVPTIFSKFSEKCSDLLSSVFKLVNESLTESCLRNSFILW